MGKASRRKRDDPDRQKRLHQAWVEQIKARGGPRNVVELLAVRCYEATLSFTAGVKKHLKGIR
jgi:hypothetical protein